MQYSNWSIRGITHHLHFYLNHHLHLHSDTQAEYAHNSEIDPTIQATSLLYFTLHHITLVYFAMQFNALHCYARSNTGFFSNSSAAAAPAGGGEGV